MVRTMTSLLQYLGPACFSEGRFLHIILRQYVRGGEETLGCEDNLRKSIAKRKITKEKRQKKLEIVDILICNNMVGQKIRNGVYKRLRSIYELQRTHCPMISSNSKTKVIKKCNTSSKLIENRRTFPNW